MRFIYSLGALLAFILISCDYESVESDNAMKADGMKQAALSSSSAELYYKIVEIDDVTEQLLVVSALEPKQVLDIWKVKLEDYRLNNELNSRQSTFLDNLERELTIDLFIENSDDRNRFDFDSKVLEAQELFGENEGWYLLTKVENINHRIEKINNSIGSPVNEIGTIEACNCSKDSHCSRIVSIGWLGIGWEYGDCKNTTCYRTKFLWWESSDNRKCTY